MTSPSIEGSVKTEIEFLDLKSPLNPPLKKGEASRMKI
jgi:hypothetical protein